MAEISDAELNELRGAHRLLDSVMKNPATRDDAQRIIKKLNPKAVLPEIDLKQQVGGVLQKMMERIGRLEKQIVDEREDGKFQTSFRSAMDKHGITKDAEPKVQALMKERNIFDPEAAALLFVNQNPPPEPAATSGWMGSAMFDEPKADTEWGQWFADPAGMRDKEIGKFFSERKAA